MEEAGYTYFFIKKETEMVLSRDFAPETLSEVQNVFEEH